MGASKRDNLGEQLSAYLDGELSPEERAAVDELLAADAEARALWAELEATARAVRALPRATAPPFVLEGIVARLEREELIGEPEDEATLARRKQKPWRALLALAAVLVIAVGGGLWVHFQLGQQAPRVARGPAADGLLETAPADRRALEGPSGASDAGELRALTATKDRARGTVVKGKSDKSAASPAPEFEDVGRDLADRLSALGYISRAEPAGGHGGAVTSAPAAEMAMQSGMPASAAKAKPDYGLTLEQKLATAGEVVALADHRFESEPLQLAVVLTDSARAPEVDRRITAFLREQAIQPVLSGDEAEQTAPASQATEADRTAVVAIGAPPEKPMAAKQAVAAAAAAAPTGQTALFYRGVPMRNFTPQAPGEEQILIRLPAADVPVLVRQLSGAAGLDGLELSIGGWTASGRENVLELAKRATQPVRPARRAGAAVSPEPADRIVRTDRGNEEFPAAAPAIEMMDAFQFDQLLAAWGWIVPGSQTQSPPATAEPAAVAPAAPAEPPAMVTLVVRVTAAPVPTERAVESETPNDQ